MTDVGLGGGGGLEMTMQRPHYTVLRYAILSDTFQVSLFEVFVHSRSQF